MEYFNFLKEPTTLNLVVAACLGSLLGLERELARKDPSLRTFMLICLGSCTFSMISLHCLSIAGTPLLDGATTGLTRADPGRIAAQIVVGIGFLGAGSIFKSRDRIMGLTTAALMWVAAAVGMAVGFDRFDIAFKATIVALSFMVILSLAHQVLRFFYPE